MSQQLFANDGGPADVVNAMADLFGGGAIMDSFRLAMGRERASKRQAEEAAIKRIAQKVHQAKARKVFGEADMKCDYEIPEFLYHRYALAFKLKAEEEGIALPGNGYECWNDDEPGGFVDWYKRKYPQLCYNEAPRNATIIKSATFTV